MPRLHSILMAGAALATALVAFAAPAGAASAGTRPGPARAAAAPAAAGSFDYFNSDSCVPGTSFCMAVGAYKSGTVFRGLSEVLRGSSWVTKPVAVPRKLRNIFSNEVSCASALRCLLVGQHYSKTAGANLAEAWNGKVWKIIAARGPSGTTVSALQDVACPVAGFCLVVGVARAGGRFHATAYTWANSRIWKQVRVPGPRGARSTELAGLACADAAHCMAVGNYFTASGKNLPYAVRWHSGTWKVLSMPNVRGATNPWLEGDSCPAAGQCVVAGAATTPHRAPHGFAEIYSAGKWRLAAKGAANTGFLGASCPATNLCLVSGFSSRSGLVLEWNGNSWTNLNFLGTVGNLPHDFLEHVSCAAATTCEVVGGRYNLSRTEHTLAEVWNGSNWAIQTTANP